ncbi:MAG TPA: class IV adenylate cyclase [Pyrinomonadaceae bacterium]|nr:class IV adenylate cyclase [Pyrinomonadaceae bacterium]
MEIEKKYRLTAAQRDDVLQRLKDAGAEDQGEEFEENTLYGGGSLDRGKSVLRLRRVGKKALLTYKERFAGESAVKRQREDETAVEDPSAMALILDAIGFKPVLVYEKRRQTWKFGETEVVVDELPFGLFMEIEGDEGAIDAAEQKLGIAGLPAEDATYPHLAEEHGERVGDVIEARFPKLAPEFVESTVTIFVTSL